MWTSPPRYILAAPVRRHSLFQDYRASFSPFPFIPDYLDSLPSVALGNLAHAQSISAKGFSRMFHPKCPTSAAHRRTTTTDTTTTSKYKLFQPVPASPRRRICSCPVHTRPCSRTHSQHRRSPPTQLARLTSSSSTRIAQHTAPSST